MTSTSGEPEEESSRHSVGEEEHDRKGKGMDKTVFHSLANKGRVSSSEGRKGRSKVEEEGKLNWRGSVKGLEML
jgi:hypothetical protein